MNHTSFNMRRITLTIIVIILAFLLGVMFAPYLHADTGVSKSATAPTCYVMVRQANRTWRYGTAASQMKGEVRRTIQRGMPFGYRMTKGNCKPAIRL